MESVAVLSQNHTDYSSMEKSDVSKSLYGLIQWEEILRSGVFLAHRDHQLLEKAQENLGVVLDSPQDSKELASMLLKIADNCTSNLTVQQYVFTRIEEILGLGVDFGDADIDVFGPKHAPLFTTDGKRLVDAPFLRALNSPNIYLQRSASLGLACLYTVCEGNTSALIQYINGKLSSPSIGVWELGCPALSMLARRQSARKLFISEGGVGHVVGALTRLGANGSAQQIYELTFILWTLSLGCEEKDLALFLSAGAIRVLFDSITAAPTRKVVRMSIATLRELSSSENDDVLTEMLTAGIDRSLESMIQSNAHKQAGDTELEQDVKFLHDVLSKNYKELSTFDKWASEVHSGALRWGIVHTDKFWRENARLVEQDEFKLLKLLIALLSSHDSTIVCIALYDLGEFTRYYPNGRVIASRLRGKEIALEMIGHSDPAIQTQALQCISKIMVANWEFMK